jgi:hypothetical protein
VAGCNVTSVRFNDRTVFFVSEIIVELVNAMFLEVLKELKVFPVLKMGMGCKRLLKTTGQHR